LWSDRFAHKILLLQRGLNANGFSVETNAAKELICRTVWHHLKVTCGMAVSPDATRFLSFLQ
jgi:hypothetical protein